MGAVPRLENGRAFTGLGGSTPSPSALGGMAEWQGSALLARRAPCVPQVRVLLPPYVRSGAVDMVRRATVTREEQVRSLPPELARPRGRTGDDTGLSIRKLRVRIPPGVLRLAVGEWATPPVSGTGDRRFEPCRPDFVRGGEGAFLASLMSSRRGFESRPRAGTESRRLRRLNVPRRLKPAVSEAAPVKPAPSAKNSLGGVAQLRRALACQARGRRFESDRPRSVVTVV